ncbi:MAG: hypothetical protein K2W95_09245 [Candidatus Obscuribacterales bacterium]|nr:hypothetical protein [Candidatus Obscuribacterales bacterium]
MTFRFLLSFCLAMSTCTSTLPVFAQGRADTGAYGGWSNGETAGNYYGDAGNTYNQNIGLSPASSGNPLANGSSPGNLALRQLGKRTLPPTRLSGFVKAGGDAVFGGDRPLLPFSENRDKGFTTENHLENAMLQCPDLTTNHRISSPSAWDFPQ